MRRQRDEMQVNVAGLRRNIKNLAHNYSDAQIKVREATSNDPWGPSSTLMSEIADLTYNVVAYTEIMQMIWKRLNDHGKNWRHVYKALVLLEYLIKTGSEKVAQQCKENIFAVQTLKDFQYMEESKDKGINVREKAKQLVTLLRDEERLRNERARALKAKERFAQSASAFGSDGALSDSSPPSHRDAFRSSDWSSPSPPPQAALPQSREMESARPQTAGEEELQLQLALAMSREEAEQEEQRRRSDDVRLQLALSESQQDFRPTTGAAASTIVDLLDVSLSDVASGGAPPSSQANDPWGLPPPTGHKTQTASDPWGNSVTSTNHNHATSSPVVDPWTTPTGGATNHRAVAPPPPTTVDPWAPPTNSPIGFRDTNSSPLLSTDRPSPLGASSNLQSPSSDLSEFDVITNRNRNNTPSSNGVNGKSPNNNSNGLNSDPFDLGHLDDLLGGPLPNTNSDATGKLTGCIKKTPASFLGENSALVNLDNLIKPVQASTNLVNATSTPASPFGTANPFQDERQKANNMFREQMQPVRPSMNQIKQAPFPLMNDNSQSINRDPWAPVNSTDLTATQFDNSPWTPINNQATSRDQNNSSSAWTVQPSSRDQNAAWIKQESVNPFLS